MNTNSKLTVVGAGAVGSSVAYAAMIRGSARHIALYDIAAEKTEAEVLDLAHGSQFTGNTDIIGGSDIEVARDSDVIVITAGAKQKPGQSRRELADTNARITRTLMEQLLSVAPEAVYVIVTNPCDPMAMVAQEFSGLPANQVFSSGTTLDTSRLRWLLADQAGVSRTSVHAHIVGEHGDSEFALWSTASIGTVPILEWTIDGQKVFTRESLDALTDEVRGAAYKVIQGKGATNYAIGLSSARIVEAVLGAQNAVLNVAPVLSDFQGIDGVALSVPCIVGEDGAFPIRETPFSDDELTKLRESAETLREVVDGLSAG